MAVHPYYPREISLAYEPNTYTTLELLVCVGAVFVVLLVGTVSTAKAKKPGVSLLSCLTLFWFVLCGLLHCGFEAYWLYYRHQLSTRTDIIAQLWKEYALADSRYMTSDDLLVTLETITVFVWGPLCFLAAYDCFHDNARGIYVQSVVAIGHLYSCSLYFILDFLQGFSHSDPHWLYFWVYFVGFNAPWLVIPAVLLYTRSHQIVRRMQKIKNN
ncbi:EBP domain protein [Gongronella butleri]|nr:EBP domain protein [Gongronella butleri]